MLWPRLLHVVLRVQSLPPLTRPDFRTFRCTTRAWRSFAILAPLCAQSIPRLCRTARSRSSLRRAGGRAATTFRCWISSSSRLRSSSTSMVIAVCIPSRSSRREALRSASFEPWHGRLPRGFPQSLAEPTRPGAKRRSRRSRVNSELTLFRRRRGLAAALPPPPLNHHRLLLLPPCRAVARAAAAMASAASRRSSSASGAPCRQRRSHPCTAPTVRALCSGTITLAVGASTLSTISFKRLKTTTLGSSISAAVGRVSTACLRHTLLARSPTPNLI